MCLVPHLSCLDVWSSWRWGRDMLGLSGEHYEPSTGAPACVGLVAYVRRVAAIKWDSGQGLVLGQVVGLVCDAQGGGLGRKAAPCMTDRIVVYSSSAPTSVALRGLAQLRLRRGLAGGVCRAGSNPRQRVLHQHAAGGLWPRYYAWVTGAVHHPGWGRSPLRGRGHHHGDWRPRVGSGRRRANWGPLRGYELVHLRHTQTLNLHGGLRSTVRARHWGLGRSRMVNLQLVGRAHCVHVLGGTFIRIAAELLLPVGLD
mmetsp:Transcript_16652/g.29731  ORF Transcript_16652/g.29731 Transcript_16652/m.29731 type:complete len:256 (-) Transcript_16652:362-1129(-)